MNADGLSLLWRVECETSVVYSFTFLGGHERKAWTEYFDLIPIWYIYTVNRFSLNHVLEHTLLIQIAYTI